MILFKLISRVMKPPVTTVAASDIDTALPAAAPSRWPKIHLIYYGLASIDVAAIVASLFIGFHMMSTFEKGADRNLTFDRQSAALVSFSSAIVEAQASVITAVVQRSARVAASDFRVKAETFRRELSQFRKLLEAVVNDVALKKTLSALNKIETGFASMERHSLNTIAAISAGEDQAAMNEFAQMQARYVTLQFLVRDISQKVNLLRKTANENDLADVRTMQRYEYAIAPALALIICCIIGYGHFIGQLMKRKYGEVRDANRRLETSHAEIELHAHQLAEVNGSIASLNRQLQENLTQLQNTQDELLRKGKMAQLGQLTATVAHELRNPLGAVRTSAYLLERKVKGKGLGVEPQLERIGNGITRCDDIISQLLDFARIKTVQPEMLPLDDWLAKVVEEEAVLLPESVLVECCLGLGDRVVAFDPARMRRAVINLMSNASEAMVGKGERSPPPGTSARITISSQASARGIELIIADNGPGIVHENLTKIFEPLFTTKNFGTGLGLPAVQRILEQHGGGLDVHSQPGRGATFTAWWPQAADKKEAA